VPQRVPQALGLRHLRHPLRSPTSGPWPPRWLRSVYQARGQVPRDQQDEDRKCRSRRRLDAV